jgi:enolase
MPTIERLTALEILDSRGRPTVRATCTLAGGTSGTASVPSGASTGTAEALELRDGDLARYGGLGCRTAVRHVNEDINDALRGQAFTDQATLDNALLALDGTPNKGRLGANAILAVSLAFARASAADQDLPLYRYFAGLIGQPVRTLPRLTVNLFSGGKHAGGQVSIQDVLVVPISASSIDDSLATTYAVYQAAAAIVEREYNMRLLRADEGGLAPPCAGAEDMLRLAVAAIEQAGYAPGRDVAIAVDVASTHFYRDGTYVLDSSYFGGRRMIDRLTAWIDKYPIVSLEDGLSEDDWHSWPILKRTLGDRCLILGDDFLCTNPDRIQRAIDADAANALLLKVNQVGTLTEAAEAYRLARSAKWHVTVSARSGETEDDWLADLAVGWGADHIKIGSITQSERLAKYNRLLEIEKETGFSLR